MRPMTRRVLFLAGALLVAGSAGAARPGEGRTTLPPPGTAAQEARHPEVDFEESSCVDCHLRMTRRAVREWEAGPHGVVNVGCFVCHGDGVEEFFLQPPSEICLSCHSDQAVDFASVPQEGCFDCHAGHTLSFHER